MNLPRHAIGYVAASGISAVGAFLAVGLVTRALGMGGYGRWSLVEPMFAVLGNLALAGTNYGAIRFVSKEGCAPAEVFRRLRGKILPLAVGVSVLGAGIPWLVGLGPWPSAAFAAAIILDANMLLGLAVLRAGAMPWRYAIIVAARVGGYLAGILGMMALAERPGAGEMVYCWLMGSACGSAASEGVLATLPRGARDSATPLSLRAGVSYGLPILVASFLVAPLSYLDRMVLADLRGAEVVGEYAVHVRVASILTPMLTAPIAMWWPAARFRHARDADGGVAFFAWAKRLASAAYVATCLIIWTLGSWVLEIFAPEAVFHGLVLALLLAALAMVGLANHVFNVGLLEVGHTRGTVVAASAAVLALGVTVGPLVAWWGQVGGAAATCVGALSYLGVVHGLSTRARQKEIAPGLLPSAASVSLAVLWGLAA